MRCIYRTQTDPYFNIAAEEYMLKNSEEDIFMLWRNDPAVIIGKHQNAFAEVNHQYVKERNIAVIRRISGGGTVYHDHGNINFTFIANGEPGQLVDFKKFTTPVAEALNKYGLNVTPGNRNSLYINDLKISGNAEHVYRNRVLHHGTLLYSSELDVLENAIKPSVIQFDDKAVKSIRSKVGNISDHLKNPPPVEEFTGMLFREIQSLMEGSFIRHFSLNEIQEIEQLSINKYLFWEWNYGYSPPFSYTAVIHHDDQNHTVRVHVAEGRIVEIETDGSQPVTQLNELLYGVILSRKSLFNKLRKRYPPHQTEQLLIALSPSLSPAGTAEHLPEPNV